MGREDPIEADLLAPGDRSAAQVSEGICEYLDSARSSLDVAIYDFAASTGASANVARALEAAASRGVRVRVAFNLARAAHPAAPRPPRCSPQEIDGLSVPTRGIHGEGTLMHHKYVVRDATSVWTGSLNWTDDAFALEENVVVRVDSAGVAAAFSRDFEQLWTKGSVESSGGDGEDVVVGSGNVQAFFAPRGRSLAHVVAEHLARAEHHVRVLSPVLTAGAILGTLAEIAGRASFDVSGAYDATQMGQVESQWAEKPANHWKLEAWRVIERRLSGKHSTPYSASGAHDYMHAKAIVADGTVLAGSYNLSRHGTENAENVVVIRSGAIAAQVTAFADRVAARYAAPPSPEPNRDRTP